MDCFKCYMSSRRCQARGKIRECQRLNSPKTTWQSRLKWFLEDIETTEQDLWKEKMLTGEEVVEVVELEEEIGAQMDVQEAENGEKKADLELDEDIKLAGIEFRGLKDQSI